MNLGKPADRGFVWATSGLVLHHFGARAGLLLEDGLAKASPFSGSLVYWHLEVMFTAPLDELASGV